MKCVVCGTPIDRPIYESLTPTAINSLAQLSSGQTVVWHCAFCGHTQSNELPSVEAFYDTEYNISLGSLDEDQVYEVIGEKVIYRHDHQMRVLAEKVRFSPALKVLDFGCAKATMMRRLRAHQGHIDIHLFDVSSNYRPFWVDIAPARNQAIHETPTDWLGRFDLVTSFFAFEHIPDPASAARHVHALLADGGQFYCVVPYVITNIGDFLVVDHVNHFTVSSVERLLTQAGFAAITIDVASHRGAMVVTAVKSAEIGAAAFQQMDEVGKIEGIAAYWQRSGEWLAREEERLGDRSTAIYGAGFYGAYILSALQHPDRVTCVVDRSPFLQGKAIGGIPICAPVEIGDDVSAVYVGLNPSIPMETRRAIARNLDHELDVVLLPFMPT